MDSGAEQVKFQQQEKPHFNQALVPLQAFIPKADELKDGWGVTDLYSTGCPELDDYLGGGYGRKNGGYEIVLIFGKFRYNIIILLIIFSYINIKPVYLYF